MIEKNKLLELNEKFWLENKDKFQFIHTGFFNGNHILFVGQNPGQPWSDDMKKLVDDCNSLVDYTEMEQKYQNIIKNTKITSFINNIAGEDWVHISFTNLVKCPTLDNSQPTEEQVKYFEVILQKQILLVNPNIPCFKNE